MRTTLKRGVGRGAELNGNGHAVYPPAVVSAITRYEQPMPERSRLNIIRRVLIVTLLAAVSLALAAGGGLYLWYHQSIAAIRCHDTDCRTAQKRLVGLPGQAAIALIVGYDYRVGDGSPVGSRSDTMMREALARVR